MVKFFTHRKRNIVRYLRILFYGVKADGFEPRTIEYGFTQRYGLHLETSHEIQSSNTIKMLVHNVRPLSYEEKTRIGCFLTNVIILASP